MEQEKTFNLSLTEKEVNTILAILSEAALPWKVSNPLIAKIHGECQKQIDVASEAEKGKLGVDNG